MTEAGAAIRTRALTKHYGAVEALRGIDLDVREGEIFGLIGPDGAGKTSAFQILGGVMEATSGTTELLGQPARGARAYVGYLTQVFSLYPDLSAAENLRYVGDLRRVPVRDIEARGRRYLSMFGMERFADRLAGRLSGGMKQKLALACALVAEPRILLLDEPTTGVDPLSRRQFWDLIDRMSESGTTVLVTTHYLDEAEHCHRIAIIQAGKLAALGTATELKQVFAERPIIEVQAVQPVAAMEALERLPDVEKTSLFGTSVHAVLRSAVEPEQAVARALAAAGLEARSVTRVMPSLEDVFLDVVERTGAA
jgi:ABC-2 type transport system ATP-binding protein